ncbi:MAG: Unknown protein, partial [uncultured Sulfurovum sp.]
MCLRFIIRRIRDKYKLYTHGTIEPKKKGDNMANLGPADYSPYPVATYDGLYTPPEGKAM